MKLLVSTSVVLLSCSAMGQPGPQPALPLWPEGDAPFAEGTGPDHTPTLTPFLPEAGKATGAAVIVCPGGGYQSLMTSYEGRDVARWFAERGIAGFLLVYRHAPVYRHPVPLADARRAIRTVRARAAEWGIDPGRIGIMGFSAGGHLAATAGTLFEPGEPRADDPVERASSRPDFLVLCYPVITMRQPHLHTGSRENLLGADPSPGDVERLSAETQVTADTPPAFLFHTTDDEVVPVQHSVLFYLACVEAGVPAELHAYEPGRHGVGLAQDQPALESWPDLLLAWLRTRGILR
jgi:acetyl esterase/lipase